MNHTKLPWIATTVEKTGNDWLICYVGNDYENMEWIITTDGIHASEMNGSDAKDDAAFIVKAVNNHQKLVDALEASVLGLLDMEKAKALLKEMK